MKNIYKFTPTIYIQADSSDEAFDELAPWLQHMKTSIETLYDLEWSSVGIEVKPIIITHSME